MEISVYGHGTIGAILKTHRENNGVSQRDIASTLNYRSVNFISMLESGRSSIALNRVMDVVGAYQLPNEMALVIIKMLHPDIWTLFTTTLKGNAKLCADPYKLDAKVIGFYKKMLRKYGMKELAAALKAA